MRLRVVIGLRPSHTCPVKWRAILPQYPATPCQHCTPIRWSATTPLYPTYLEARGAHPLVRMPAPTMQALSRSPAPPASYPPGSCAPKLTAAPTTHTNQTSMPMPLNFCPRSAILCLPGGAPGCRALPLEPRRSSPADSLLLEGQLPSRIKKTRLGRGVAVAGHSSAATEQGPPPSPAALREEASWSTEAPAGSRIFASSARSIPADRPPGADDP